MTSRSWSFTPVLIVALAVGTSRLAANVTFLNGYTGTATEVTSATELAYQADASNLDLLNGATPSAFTNNATFPTVGAWNTGNGATVPELNDGIHGVSFAAAGNSVQGAWPNQQATVTYTIGPGTNNLGHDITSIRSIAAWNGAGFGNQAWTLAVQLAGGGAFVDVATVNYQPLGATSLGATKVDLSGLNITGVQALKLTTIAVNGGVNGGAFVWRELDVVGVPTVATPPIVSTLSPADGDLNAAVNGNLVVTFNENVVLGTGEITINNLDTLLPTVITLPDPQVTVSGAVMTINPSANLAPGTNYAVRIDDTVIQDLAGTSYAGITDDQTWNFKTVPADSINPAVASFSPADNSNAVSQNADLIVAFNENVVLMSGDITIRNLSNFTETVITLPDARVSVSGAVLTINPSTNLAPAANYAIQIDASAIEDTGGNSYAGIDDDTTWNFTAADETFSATQYAYSGNVSAADLLHGLTPVTTGWNSTNNASPLELTDGIHGGAFMVVPGDQVQGAWTTVGATATYNLGTGPGGAGYNITSVQSIADWVSVGFGNQAWTIEVKPVGGSYITLATVNYQPLGGAAGGSTKVTLTHPGGVLATGVELIKITANQVNGGANAGAFVWRELDVFGVPSNNNTFANWISNPAFGIAPGQQGLNQDPDGDGIENGVENFFGGDPGEFNPGLVAGVKTVTTFTFTHSQGTLAADLTSSYKWSTDLVTFHADGASNGNTTVEFTTQPDTPAVGTTTVTANVIGTALDKLFVTVSVEQE